VEIQQAIFTSSARGQIKGYQLVATSDGIERSLARELQLWSPSQVADDDPSQWTLNYYPVDANHIAVTRTVLGGPEYSGRGGTQVVTLILILTNPQFAAYDNHAVRVAQTALALGGLRLPSHFPSRLPSFELPDCPLVYVTPQNVTPQNPSPSDGETVSRSLAVAEELCYSDTEDREARLLDKLHAVVAGNQRLAIVGALDPRRLVERMLDTLPVRSRRLLSFTTGLPPALSRPFGVHFLPAITAVMRQWLRSESVQVIEAHELVGLT
jgi:hypothetical protein